MKLNQFPEGCRHVETIQKFNFTSLPFDLDGKKQFYCIIIALMRNLRLSRKIGHSVGMVTVRVRYFARLVLVKPSF